MVCLRLNQNLLEASPMFKHHSMSTTKICFSTNTFSKHMLSEHKHNSCECDPFTVLEFPRFQIPELAMHHWRVSFRIEYKWAPLFSFPTQFLTQCLDATIACSGLGQVCT